MFTNGKDRKYERLMKQTPSIKPRGGGKRKHKYVYADIACEFCVHAKICKYNICPHIVGNLDDLVSDTAFTSAVDNADTCTTKHKQTLMYIKSLQAVAD